MRRIHRTARKVSNIPRTTILIEGEIGTGKELLAREIHALSCRSQGPFLRVNCSGRDDRELDPLLFGSQAAQPGGTPEGRPGLLELAQGGTLCVVEIGLLPPTIQAKLLPMMERSEGPLGMPADHPGGDARIIATTSRSLAAEVALRRFREDLFFQLQILPIVLPPLRKRPEDIPELAEGFLREHARILGRPCPVIAPDALADLGAYDWPGNVRELRSVMERALHLAEAGEVIQPEHLRPRGFGRNRSWRRGTPLPRDGVDFRATLDGVARELLERALRESRGNRTRAARRLGLPRHVLRYQLDRLEIDPDAI